MNTQRRRLLAGAAAAAAAGLAARHAAAREHGHDAAAPRRPRPALGLGAALAPDGALWVVHLDAAGRLLARRSRSPGTGFDDSAARVLDTAGDVVAADGENHPKIAFGRSGAAVISYTRPLARPFTGEVRLLRSTDGGTHFAAPVTVHHDRQEITHRFESIAFDAQGTLHTVWIDKRDQLLAQARSQPYTGAAIYRNESRDGGATFGPDLKVADASCECCRIALAPAPDGGVVALWRHVFPTQVRDHAFAALRGEAPAVTRATEDGWTIHGCPHHGPGLAAAAGGGFHAVWFGQREGVAAVRHGRLDAQGRPAGPVSVLPDALAEHAAVGTAGPRVAITWRSFDGQRLRWRAWLSADEGRRWQLHELGATAGAADQPRLAGDGRRLLAVWHTQAEGVRVVDLLPG